MNKHEIIQRLIGVFPYLSAELRQSIYHELLTKRPDELCETYNKSVKESICTYLGCNMYEIRFK